MRKYDIPHVANPRINYYPVKELGEMTLEEIVKKYIKTCGKADGNVAVCSKCKTPCEHGKRAIQLLANKIYDNPPIPLYGGKTMIERAKEENMKRREAEKNGELLPVNSDNMSTLFNALEKAKQDALGKEAPQPKRKARRLRLSAANGGNLLSNQVIKYSGSLITWGFQRLRLKVRFTSINGLTA